MQPTKFGFGQPMLRKEDDALLRGNGRYVADYAPAGLLYAAVLRSPHAHARFRVTDAGTARAMPGVRLVLTGSDLADLGPLPCQVEIPGAKVAVPPYPVLARDVARHVGDAVAFVVADTLERAKDAAEAIAVEWTPLPAVIDAAAALAPGAPLVWPDRPGNLCFEAGIGDEAQTARAFAAAHRTVELTVVNQRLVANYLDTRAAIGECDAGGRITLTLTSQGGHAIRDVLCKDVLRIPAERMRIVTPDVGGGFGTKLFPYREYALAAVAAERLKRPVKWVAERSEHFLGDAQGRDNLTRAKLALDANGKFLALDVDLIADMGAYLSVYAPFIPFLGAGMSPGVYDIPICHVRVRAAFTNTLPVDAYRGAGRPEAAYAIERLVDTAAREIGMAPDVLRRKNFIRPSAMPYRTATGKLYDSGEFAGHLKRAQEAADWAGFNKRLRQSTKAGKLRGIGLATYVEACGNNGPEAATVKLARDGTIVILIGSQSTGQGHHTAYAQIIADHFDVPPEQVRVVQGDTDVIATGMGTGGSSSIPCGGASIAGASKKLAANLKALAADALEASPADLEIAGGSVRVVGTDRALAFAELAALPKATPELLATSDAFTPGEATYPNGTHLAEVEVDPATGAVDILNYVVVDDFGVTLNPLMLAGQVHGGAVQGLGQALMERAVYDASGQLVTASLMDYALPRARDAPAFAFETRNVKCATNPLGVKGAGEAGAIGSCPALINAVVDALWRAFRIRHVDMPATPERVWQAIEEGRRVHTL
ncbi:MAG TPA: xanthine dehydrogenase family protein molybdopterin-binding subunit [Xanthobacteraceae bacterium]|nr:xanthine dehydrogenase family protein molybdopterin-binding subunit [Xanthobacteraceae bacterium]